MWTWKLLVRRDGEEHVLKQKKDIEDFQTAYLEARAALEVVSLELYSKGIHEHVYLMLQEV